MMGEITQCFQNTSGGFQIYEALEDLIPPSVAVAGVSSGSDAPAQNLLYNLTVLREKVQQMQSLIGLFMSPEAALQPEPMSVAVSTAGSLVQDIIVAASSLLYTFQQTAAVGCAAPLSRARIDDETIYDSKISPPPARDIIELDAADLLAKYTHYCQICGKGFKRDANLRMHMRAHGDEYKTNAALANPEKTRKTPVKNTKYSCPHEGCRWNKNHAKFQPLKSMICVKNHYKRSHCPKMYVCNRCNRKQFSVLSDLRTHEKHCGDVEWVCSCGTTFSRKDKLLGHVGLFAGHTPAADCFFKLQGSSPATGVQHRGSAGIQIIDASCDY